MKRNDSVSVEFLRDALCLSGADERAVSATDPAEKREWEYFARVRWDRMALCYPREWMRELRGYVSLKYPNLPARRRD